MAEPQRPIENPPASFQEARDLLKTFKGDAYANGSGVLQEAGPMAAPLGKRAALICDRFPGSDAYAGLIAASLAGAGVEVSGCIDGAAPNAPLEDLARVTADLVRLDQEDDQREG